MEREATVGQAFKNWSKKTTLRVLSIILNSRTTLTRVICTSFILLFGVILIQKIVDRIQDYLKDQVGTQITHTYKSSGLEDEALLVTFKFINWLKYSSYLKRFRKTNFTDSPRKYLKKSLHGSRRALYEAKKNFEATLVISESQIDVSELSLNQELILNSIISCRYNDIQCDLNDFKLIEADLTNAAYLQFRPRNHAAGKRFR